MSKSLLFNVLNEMPARFTSHQFVAKARQSAVPERLIIYKAASKFLEQNAKRTSRKTWEKTTVSRKPYQTVVFGDNQTNAPTESEQIENAIKLLKLRGYKVLMPTTEYKEV